MESGESEWVADIKLQTKRLTSLTNDLIYLTRMEEENYKLPFVEFPLSDLVSEISQSFTSIFKTNGKNFNTRIDNLMTLSSLLFKCHFPNSTTLILFHLIQKHFYNTLYSFINK